MTAAPDSWQEFFLLGITREGGSEVQYAGMTEDITGMEFGDKDISQIVLANGGRLTKLEPQGEENITLKVYPIDAGLTGNGAVQLFHPQTEDDTTSPIAVNNTLTRKRHKLVFLWTTQLPESPAAASTVPATGEPAYRIHIVNAYNTRYKPSFDGKNLSAEITFKWVPFNKSGLPNKREESADSAIPLPAIAGDATSMT